MVNDLIVERMTGWHDGAHIKAALNDLIEKHNKLVRALYLAKVLQQAEKAKGPIEVKPKHINQPADVVDYLIQLNYRCQCVAAVPAPHPNCSYRLICSECHKPYVETEDHDYA